MNRKSKTVQYSNIMNKRWRENLSEKDFRHLVNSMKSLESSIAEKPSIPLYGKDDWSVVTDYYDYAASKGITYPSWQLEYELSRESKFGGQGGRAPWPVLKPEVEMYVTNPEECKAEPILATERKFKGLNCQRRSLSEVIKHQKAEDKIQSTANGWRRFDLKKDDPEAQKDAIYCAGRPELWETSYGYVFSYDRKNKHRIFIPGPFCLNLLQAQFHDPLLEAMQTDLMLKGSRSEFYFYGDKIGFYNLWPMMASKSKGINPKHILYVVRDFFHMDTTQGKSQKLKHYVRKVANAFNIRIGSPAYQELCKIMTYSNEMPIVTPSGVITNTDKGEASGVTITNQSEGFSNEDFSYDFENDFLTYCHSANIHISKIDSVGNGDDGLSRFELTDTDRLAEVVQLAEIAADNQCKLYGYKKNDKWKINLGTYGIYCQYEIYQDESGMHADYPVSLALNAGMHPMHQLKKEDWDSDFIDWRWESILRNLYGRKDFEIVIDYVDTGMKRGLFGKTREDFMRIFLKYRKYRALRNVEDRFNEANPLWTAEPKLSPVIRYIAAKRGIIADNLPSFTVGHK